MHRLGKLFMAAALAVVPMACKDDLRKGVDKSAEHLQDQKEDLREESKELREAVKEQQEDMREGAGEFETKHNVDQVAGETKDVIEEAADVAEAKSDFQDRRQLRADQLRLLHSVVASQTMLINTVATGTRLTDRASANLSEKIQIFQMRVDEAGNAIELLQQTHEDNFKAKDDDVTEAMERLEDAREEAWQALNDGDRIQPS